MSLCGNIEEVTDKALKDKFWRDQFAPYYQNGKDDPLYGILKFIPLSYKYYDYSSGIPQEVKGKF
jgi:general stress protein 26